MMNDQERYWADRYAAEEQAQYEADQLKALLGKLMCNGI